jgi:3-oxoacyl-[acyl-carrier protein] reductase
MPPNLAGRCGVVTEATSSVGRAVALELARDGARVALGYRGSRGAGFESAERLVGEIVRLGGEAVPLRLPAANLWELEQIIGTLVDCWGRVDFVADLAKDCSFGRAALPWMLERGHGRIVHISTAGANKVRFTRAHLNDLAARGVAINSIWLDGCLLAVQTELAAEAGSSAESQVRPARGAKPQDVAGTAFFLLAQECCMTGQVIDLSGGRPAQAGRRRRLHSTLQLAACSFR